MSDDGKWYVPIGEAADLTRHPVRVLRLWARQGRIPALRVARSWYVAESDLPAIEAMPRRRRTRG